MTTYVLIVVIAVMSYSRPSVTTLTQEFSTFENCESARKNVEKAHGARRGDNVVSVISQGCYKK